MPMSAMKACFQIAECSSLYRQKKDGMILEHPFNGKEGRVGFRKKILSIFIPFLIILQIIKSLPSGCLLGLRLSPQAAKP